jgi:hypothetical protein
MKYEQPIKQILLANRHLWDHPQTRPSVRENFQRIIDCRTLALGAEVYSSGTEEKLVFHTCKSRACPSCGYRATLLWQREQWASLPDIPYSGIVFTMPNVLWPIFQQNRHLLHDLPALGAAAIQRWVKARYGVQVLIMVVPHTFGRKLNFNAHLHILVSAVGMHEREGRLVTVQFSKKALMHIWRYAVITYLREALAAGVLQSHLPPPQLSAILTKQYERWWNIDISRFQSKAHFLRYAGRYVRRLPMAQRRFTRITDREVEFWTKDLKQKRVVETRHSVANFLALLAEHVLDRYRHAIRYFGLLAPRTKHRTSPALFLLLKQVQRPRPQRLSWRGSLRKYFGIDPLIDRHGQPMHWVRRMNPTRSAI